MRYEHQMPEMKSLYKEVTLQMSKKRGQPKLGGERAKLICDSQRQVEVAATSEGCVDLCENSNR
ncbi:MAG: hypothetical protein JWP89_5691 [Schlesneria sp.]|nr:hypothetical protein [Schlesneria sp.]